MGIRGHAERDELIEGLINTKESIELIGLYTAVLKLAEKGEIERARNFCGGFNLHL